ncbi:MarR family winged helix-turn-helix transcriptional regulator [Acrocarpospora pleiomorpha]|nr:MarR family winged helix-turn-helix transcriptional regulator [Acrocarpospora pleiomorpha]
MRAETVLAPLGLRPRHVVTLTVLRNGGACNQQALATMLAMDATNVVGLLNELEAQKLIERRRAPEDRRRHVVQLTEAGTQRLADVEAALAAVDDEVLASLDADQRETLYALLQQAVSNGKVICTETVVEC